MKKNNVNRTFKFETFDMSAQKVNIIGNRTAIETESVFYEGLDLIVTRLTAAIVIQLYRLGGRDIVSCCQPQLDN